ncbi:MAG: CPBP family intramembrane metalloprotease [Lachnospiraceae bacterium]|nr:CPBP family intramembrane metalloprotease [Lachnospiraceae bacterium]
MIEDRKKNLKKSWLYRHRGIIMSGPLGLFYALFLNSLLEILPLAQWFPRYQAEIRPVMFRYPLLIGILIYGIGIPIIEEFLFRFLLFGRLRIYVSAVAAGVGSSLVFGIYHGNALQFVYAFLSGLLLCYVYWKCDSILAPILFHGFANGFVYLIASLMGFDILQDMRQKLIACALGLAGTVLILLQMKDMKNVHSVRPEKPIFPGSV